MKIRILYIVIFLSFVMNAQQKDYYLPKGNDNFKNKEFVEAEANYRISQSLNPEKTIASFNLGNSVYRMDQFNEAEYTYQKAIKKAQTKTEKHKIYHNLGNTFMAQKKYKEAVEAYKNALRNDPYDEESRYNYALAKEFLKNNPDNDNKDDDNKKDSDKDKKDNEDKSDDKKDSDKNKKDNEDKEDDKKDSDKDKKDKEDKEDGNNKDQSQKPKSQNGISKQRLESLLDAVNNEEKKTQEKVNMHKEKGKPILTDKDW